MAVFDDVTPKNKLLLYEHQIEWVERKPTPKRSDARPIELNMAEPLKLECQHFLDCIKTRQNPLCPLEDGHRSTSFAHLANIALATQERLLWDAENERFTNSEAANKLLSYEYRKPWKL